MHGVQMQNGPQTLLAAKCQVRRFSSNDPCYGIRHGASWWPKATTDDVHRDCPSAAVCCWSRTSDNCAQQGRPALWDASIVGVWTDQDWCLSACHLVRKGACVRSLMLLCAHTTLQWIPVIGWPCASPAMAAHGLPHECHSVRTHAHTQNAMESTSIPPPHCPCSGLPFRGRSKTPFPKGVALAPNIN